MLAGSSRWPPSSGHSKRPSPTSMPALDLKGPSLSPDSQMGCHPGQPLSSVLGTSVRPLWLLRPCAHGAKAHACNRCALMGSCGLRALEPWGLGRGGGLSRQAQWGWQTRCLQGP